MIKAKIKIKLVVVGILIVWIIGLLYLIKGDNQLLPANAHTHVHDYLKESERKSLKKWQEINNDVKGLLKIAGQEFPVVQGYDNEQYLNRSIYGDADIYGVPFIDVQCDAYESDNLIIYGHSSFNEELVFTFIADYFREDNIPEEFYYEDDLGTYSFLPVALAKIDEGENADRYWYVCDFENSLMKRTYLQEFLSKAEKVYRHTFSNEGRLMLLVTCNMQNTNERLLLLAEENVGK